jgi:hypothetical protein
MGGSSARDQVAQHAAADPRGALRVAEKIPDPWFRCQALAYVACHTTNAAARNRIISSAFQAALLTGEPNRIVVVSSWPLKALCGSGQPEKLGKEVDRRLGIIAQEGSPVRRADALNMMLGAIVKGPRPLFWRVFEQFQRACLTRLEGGKRNGKGETLLSHWVPVVDRLDPSRTEDLLQQIEGPELRKRAREALGKHAGLPLDQWITWPNLA